MLPTVIKTRRRYPNLVDEFFNGDVFPRFFNWDDSSCVTSTPAVNVQENEKDYVIEVAAPGLTKKDFHVNVENGVLVISSEKKSENEEKGGKYLRKEFSYNSFKRSFTLPENTNADDIKASHKDGVLSVLVPKTEAKVIPVKDIKIS